MNCGEIINKMLGFYGVLNLIPPNTQPHQFLQFSRSKSSIIIIDPKKKTSNLAMASLRSLRQGVGQGLRESFISEVLEPGPKRLAILGKEPPQDLPKVHIWDSSMG